MTHIEVLREMYQDKRRLEGALKSPVFIEATKREVEALFHAIKCSEIVAGLPSVEEIFNSLRKTLCNETTDCENYPGCVNNGSMDGCPPRDLANTIHKRITQC